MAYYSKIIIKPLFAQQTLQISCQLLLLRRRHHSLHFESERVHSRGSGSGRFAWPGCGQKERAGSRLTPRLKARHFQTNTIHPQNPSGYSTPRVHYAHAIHGRWRVIALFLVYESVEVSVRGQEQNSASLPLFCISSVFWGNKKGVELNAFTYLRPSTALHK